MVREDFIGLSTDTKRTNVANGSTFYCADNSKAYVFLNGTWYEKTGEEPTPPTPPTPVEDWGSITYLDENDTEQTVDLESASDVNKLCEHAQDGYTITIGEVVIPNNKIKKVNLGTSVTFLGNDFLSYLPENAEVTAPNVVYVGTQFLYHAVGLKKLEMPNLEYISNYFLYYSTIDCDLSLPAVTYIGNSFLYNGCIKEGHKIEFEALTRIGTNFISTNNADTKNFTLSLGENIKEIYGNFLTGNVGFNSDIKLPASLTTISNSYFMHSMRNFTSKVICECSADVISSGNNVLGTTDNTAPVYTTGFIFAGTNKAAWRTKFPNRTSSPYRKSTLES